MTAHTRAACAARGRPRAAAGPGHPDNRPGRLVEPTGSDCRNPSPARRSCAAPGRWQNARQRNSRRHRRRTRRGARVRCASSFFRERGGRPRRGTAALRCVAGKAWRLHLGYAATAICYRFEHASRLEQPAGIMLAINALCCHNAGRDLQVVPLLLSCPGSAGTSPPAVLIFALYARRTPF